MTARLMKLSGLAETLPVEKTRKPARPARSAKTPRQACSAAQARARREAHRRSDRRGRGRSGSRAGAPRLAAADASGGWRHVSSLLVLVAAPAAAFLVLVEHDRPGGAGAPAASPASSWRPLRARTTALSTGRAPPLTQARADDDGRGTFVRYLPLSAPVGDSERAITVATYPLRNAFATAVSRSKSPGDDIACDRRRRARRVEPDAPDQRLPGVPGGPAARRGLRAGRGRGPHAGSLRAHPPGSLVSALYGFRKSLQRAADPSASLIRGRAAQTSHRRRFSPWASPRLRRPRRRR